MLFQPIATRAGSGLGQGPGSRGFIKLQTPRNPFLAEKRIKDNFPHYRQPGEWACGVQADASVFQGEMKKANKKGD